MTTPQDQGRPQDGPLGDQPTPPAPDGRPAPRYGQYAPAGWQPPAPGAPTGQPPAWGQPQAPAGHAGWGTPGQQPGAGQPGQPPAWGQPQPPVPPAAPSGWGQPPAGPWGGAPGWQQPGPGGPGAPGPGYGAPGPGYGGYGPAWQQPPAFQPGIVPLRPLGFWEVFDGAFRAIRHNPKVMFGMAAGVVTVVVAISALVTWYVSGLFSSELQNWLTGSDPSLSSDIGLFGDSLGGLAGAYLTLPLQSLATTVLTGLLIRSVSRSVIGQRASVSEVLRGSGKRLVWVVCLTLLTFVAMIAAAAAWVGLIVLVATGTDSAGFTVLVGLLGGLAFLALALWLSIRTLLAAPALMLEGARFWPTVARAWRLSRGSFWRLLGIYLLASIMASIVSSVVSVPAALISQVLLNDPFGTSAASIALSAVSQVVTLTVTTVFMAGVVALAYIDVRMRREGLDVELARAAGGPAS